MAIWALREDNLKHRLTCITYSDLRILEETISQFSDGVLKNEAVKIQRANQTGLTWKK